MDEKVCKTIVLRICRGLKQFVTERVTVRIVSGDPRFCLESSIHMVF
jgi:hypothetical protein